MEKLTELEQRVETLEKKTTVLELQLTERPVLDKMSIGEEFNCLIIKSVLSEISEAMTSLYSDLLYTDKEIASDLFNSFVEDAQKIINCYMVEQKNTFLKLTKCL